AAVSTPIASAISAWTSARCLLWKRVMVLSRLSLDDLDDRGEETESNSVAILELVARARVEAHAVDESPIGAAGVFELDASRAGCGEDDRMARGGRRMVQLDVELGAGALAADAAPPLED